MQGSATYQAILREGRNEGLIEGRNEGLIEGRNEGLIEGSIREAQRLLLIQGEIRFGPPDDRIQDAVAAIRDLEYLERLGRRVVDANIHDWDGLLHTP